MAWQDVFPLSVARMDGEQERELRLVAQARAGAEWALAALIARYQPPVTRYLTRLTGDPERAQLLAEDLFVRMESRLRGPQGGQHLRLWLLRACTEVGLDYLREPQGRRGMAPRLAGARGPAGLLTGRVSESTQQRLRKGLDALAEVTGTTRRQFRKLIWSEDEASPHAKAAAEAGEAGGRFYDPDAATEAPLEGADALETLRYRMMRAVLAELPYGDAQCLALHLVAGLNQTEVARALGLKNTATRSRIVHGLQLFAQRFEAAAASLGLPPEVLAPRRAQPEVEALNEPAEAFAPATAAEDIPVDTAPLHWHGPPLAIVDADTAPLDMESGLYEPPMTTRPAAEAAEQEATPAPLVVDALPASATHVADVVTAPFVQLPAAADLAVVFERASQPPDPVLGQDDAIDVELAFEPAAPAIAGVPLPVEAAGEVVALAETPPPPAAIELALQLEEAAADVASIARVVPVLTPPWIVVRREPEPPARQLGNGEPVAAEARRIAPLVPVLTPMPAAPPVAAAQAQGDTDTTLQALSPSADAPPASRLAKGGGGGPVNVTALEVPALSAEDTLQEP